MVAVVGHECFPQPERSEVRVWRYMDFPKFIALLLSRQLHFARLDLLGDNWEGATSHSSIEIERQTIESIDIPDNVKSGILSQRQQFRVKGRFCQYVNCWHMNEHKSAAMWELYSKSAESIAVQSTYEKLALGLPERCHLGMVSYIDYTTQIIPNRNLFSSTMHKRASFSYENEVRAVILDSDEAIAVLNGEQSREGIKVNIDINTMIEVVHVSPNSPGWFLDVVTETTQRLGFRLPVERSSLSDDPVF